MTVDPRFPMAPTNSGQIVLPDLITPFTDLELCGGLTEAYHFVYEADVARRQLCALAAQIILECGHGQYCHNFEVGNKRANAQYQGMVQFFRCNEVEQGQIVWYDPFNPGSCFRAWDALPKALEAQLRFLGLATTGTGRPNRYQRAWDAAARGDWVAYARELGIAGYYTASPALYERGLVSIATHLDATMPTTFAAPPHVHDPIVLQPTTGHSPFSNADLDCVLSLQLPLTIDWDALRVARDAEVKEDNS